MYSIDRCHRVVTGSIWLISRLSLGYDHLVQVEYPEWLNIVSTFIFRGIARFMCRTLLSPLQVVLVKLLFYAHSWFAPRLRISSRDYEKIVLPGTAYPVTLGILSCCQLNMYFCNLCGMSLALALWQSLKCKCWYFVTDCFSPIYDYANARLKRPPDGTITASIILSTMLIVNLIMLINGFCLIGLFCYRRARKKHCSSSTSPPSSKRKRKRKRKRKHKRGSPSSPSIIASKEPSADASATPLTWTYISVLKGSAYNHFSEVFSMVMSHARWSVSRSRKQSSKPFCLTTIKLPGILLEAFASQNTEEAVSFDTDSKTIVLDNSATCHICNNKSSFTSDITPIENADHLSVSTAGGKVSPSGHGSVKWSWLDDEGNRHSNQIDEVLFFPESPVNILGVTKYAHQLQDAEGTSIHTKQKYSIFSWNFGKHTRTFDHPPSGLPELPIDNGIAVFTAFYDAFHSIYPSMRASTCCMHSQVCPSQACAHVSQSGNELVVEHSHDLLDLAKPSDNTIAVGERALLVRSGKSIPVKVTELVYDTNMMLSYRVQLQDGSILTVNKAQLRIDIDDDVGVLPSTREQVEAESSRMQKEDVHDMLQPEILTSVEEEFMHWHHRLLHLPPKLMMRLSEMGILPKRFSKMKRIPKCASCAFGQAHRRSWRHKGNEGGKIAKVTETAPGDGVSVDQIVSAQPGQIPQMSGNLTSNRITGATVFVDHVTHFVYVHLMQELSGDATIEAKAACEKVFADFGHKIRHYRADNGRFAEQKFIDDIKLCNQRISFCGVGAHHQNAIAERGIKELTLIARTILLHASRHWPEYVSTILWPLALKSASERMNVLSVNSEHQSPASTIAGTENVVNHKDFHTWGCPVYVLDAGLQSGSIGPPKWDPRSRLGIYVGHSPFHAGSVALVLNPTTGLVSPQYHLVFDDDFTTVPFLRLGTEPSNWQELCATCTEKVTEESYDLAKSWLAKPDLTSEGVRVSPLQDEVEVPSTSPQQENNQSSPPSPMEDTSKRGRKVSFSEDTQFPSTSKEKNHMPKMIDLNTAGLRRSSRTPKPVNKLSLFTKFCLITVAAFNIHRASNPASFTSRIMNQMERANLSFDGTSNGFHPLAFAAALSDNESYTMKEMLLQHDAKDFMIAMMEEVKAHEDNDHWEVVPRSEVGNCKTILAIWSFKRKRYPDGTLNKHKARLCAHGGMQQWGVNYWETYAPVVNWISVRTLLAIAVMNDLPTTAIDFVLAFPQAKLKPEERIFMELPFGMSLQNGSSKSHVLKLKKNLYGLKQAGLNWFEYLKEGLEERGFRQSEVDPCVFFRDDAILLCYVDDCIVLSQDSKTVDDIVNSLSTGVDQADSTKKFKHKYTLTNDGGIKNYLGVEVTKNDDGTIELKQKYLIERILQALSLDIEMTAASKPTPVIKPLLHKDLKGLPRKYDWNYRSLVGMLGYLQSSTRPDISMATHQCARFNNNPMLSHERSIRRIGKYLLGTQDKGIIFSPDISKGIECYVDADFSGNWNAIDSEDSENVLSRSGFIIFYAGCPIHWVSKLQTEIALSTTESEYIALSQSMRDVIPLINLLKEFERVLPIEKIQPEVKCKVFEDNTSCISVAKAPSMTPRTKHIALKYHHFRSFVKSGAIDIRSIGTTEQTADILTKPLSGELFIYLRKKMMGW